MPRRSSLLSTGLSIFLFAALTVNLRAQASPSATPDSTTRDSPPSTAQQPATPSLDFSGILFANYQYGGVKGNRSVNRFDLERAYLTFRATPGQHFGVRITADVYQQRDTTRDQYYRGWAARLKYAYGQYDFLRGGDDALRANVRLGMLQTVVIEVEEQIWQRGLSPVAVDQNGYFASADLGASATFMLPGKLGEVYATITNGPGYTSRETDRFKDYAARLTITPFAKGAGVLQGLSISPWFSKGTRASDFARRRGTVRPVSDAIRKDRAGLLLTLRDPRIAVGAHYAQRWEVDESADTTADLVPTSADRMERLLSLHTTVRPLMFVSDAPAWPLAIVLRADHIEPNIDRDPYVRNYIAGVQWELNRRTSITLDYQNRAPRDGGAGADTKVFYLHLIAGF